MNEVHRVRDFFHATFLGWLTEGFHLLEVKEEKQVCQLIAEQECWILQFPPSTFTDKSSMVVRASSSNQSQALLFNILRKQTKQHEKNEQNTSFRQIYVEYFIYWILEKLAVILNLLKVYCNPHASHRKGRREGKQCRIGWYCYMLSHISVFTFLLFPLQNSRFPHGCTIYFSPPFHPTDPFSKSWSDFGCKTGQHSLQFYQRTI